jgi:hypothetical protein
MRRDAASQLLLKAHPSLEHSISDEWKLVLEAELLRVRCKMRDRGITTYRCKVLRNVQPDRVSVRFSQSIKNSIPASKVRRIEEQIGGKNTHILVYNHAVRKNPSQVFGQSGLSGACRTSTLGSSQLCHKHDGIR